MMKIMHLLNTSSFSGAENVVCQIISMMKNLPDYRHVYCSRRGQIEHALQERGITFIPIEDMSIKELKRVIMLEKPDLIHAHDMRASFFAACSCGDIPLVCHIHNNAYDSQKISVKSILFLFAVVKARHIFWVSESAMTGYYFRSFANRKSSVLSNILDTNAVIEKSRLDKNNYNYDIVFIGRLSDEKDPVRAVNIFEMVHKQLPYATLAFVGSGAKENEVLCKIKEYGLDNNVFLLGFQNNPLKILSDAKVMLTCSKWEGLPMASLEAFCLGVPIVGTPADGLKELIDGSNGFISNKNVELANKIVELLSDSAVRLMMSNNAKQSAENWCNKDSYIANLIEEYHK